MFVAIDGFDTDGHQYIGEAIQKGAKVIMAQADKITYPKEMLKLLREEPNLTIKEALVKEIITENNEIKGIITEIACTCKTRCTEDKYSSLCVGVISIV
jgi:tRNA U34 5-carboxymethylaminomethyl modifying enzyme MnmG/GidA